MQIFPIIDPYAVHYSSFAGDVYTLDTAGITLTAGTLTASTLTDGTLSITGGDIINVDQIGFDLAAPKAQLEFGTTVPVISATHSLYQGYNTYYDGSWKRTVADNQACMLSFAADGAFHFYVQSDDLDTVDSVITWDNVMTLDNDGVFDILKVDNLTLNGAGIYSNGTIELIAAGAIYFRASDDNDDYISISTAADQTTLNFAGQDGLITADDGNISFNDENLITTGNGKVGGLANVVQLTVKSNASQAANLQNWTEADDSILASVDSGGNFYSIGGSFQISPTEYMTSDDAGHLDLHATTSIDLNANIIIPDTGYIGSASDTNAIQIAATGGVTLTQDLLITKNANILFTVQCTDAESRSAFYLKKADNDRAGFFYYGDDYADANLAGDLRIYLDNAGDVLFSTSRVGIRHDTPDGQLHVDQSSTTAAIPVQVLDQGDVDEPFTKFIGTAAAADLTRSIVDNDDVGTATLAGWVKVEVEDVGNQIADQDYYMPVYTLAAP